MKHTLISDAKVNPITIRFRSLLIIDPYQTALMDINKLHLQE